jgi:pilus assembly protein Flp/PilA
MKNLFNRFVREEAGQDLIEYVLLGALVSSVVIVGATNLGTQLNTWYDNAATWVSNNNSFGS